MTVNAHDTRRASVEQAALLCCVRAWAAARGGRGDVPARIGRIANLLDAPDAAGFIEGFMFAVQHGAVRTIEVGCPRCPTIGADERTLLDALGLAQERRSFEALLALRGLLTPEGARAALMSAEGIGSALARVGRFLPAPDDQVGQFGFAVWPAPA